MFPWLIVLLKIEALSLVFNPFLSRFLHITTYPIQTSLACDLDTHTLR